MLGRSKQLFGPLGCRLGALLGLGLGLGVVGSGCSKVEAPPFHVQLISIEAHGGPALAEDSVEAILHRSLERSPSFTAAERDQRSRGPKRPLVAMLEYRELPDAHDHGRDLLVRLNVESPKELAERLGGAGLDVTVLLERDSPTLDGDSALAADLQLATDRLATILQARLDLALGSPGAIEDLLRARDPELLILALEWVRDHPQPVSGHPPAPSDLPPVALLASLIDHRDQRVGLLAIEAIGQIGGPEHVAAVLERVRLTDTTQVSQAYDTIARLGGPEAAGFLEFAARNEDEPGRRAAAQRALRRVTDAGVADSGADSDALDRRRSARYPRRGHR